MSGHIFPSHSILRRLPRILGPLAAGVALLALPQQAWGVEQFTVSNNIFPPSGSPPTVGSTLQQTVYVTLNGSAMSIKSIVLQSAGATVSGIAEYTLGTITGCTLDPTGVTTNPIGTVCSIPVTYKPAYPGSLGSPALSRNATLVLTDGNDSKTWTFALTGAATGPLTQLVPGTISRYAGAAYTATGLNPLDNGLGSTTGAYGGDGGPAVDAQFNFTTTAQLQTQPMAYDSAGNLYVIDANNYIIRKIDNTTNHNVTTIAGTPKTGGYSGDGGAATNAKLAYPYAITLDAAGDIYFLDNTNIYGSGYVRLRRIDAVSGLITPVAGQNYSGTYDTTHGGGTCVQSIGVVNCGDSGLATYADLYGVSNMAIDQVGNIYLWGRGVAFIREITVADGKINTIVTAAQLNSTSGGYGGMTLAADGNLYIVVIDNTLNGGLSAAVIKQINLTTNPGQITNVAGGTQQSNYCTFTSAQGGFPAADLLIQTTGQSGDLASDASGNLYFSTSSLIQGCPLAGYAAVYRINPATQTAYLMADGIDASLNGNAIDVAFNAFYGYAESPYSAIPDPAGNLYVMTYNQIAEITGSNSALYMPSGTNSLQDYSTSADQTVSYVNVGNASDTIPSYDLTYETNFHVDGSYPAGSCVAGASLAPSGVCSLNLQFTPTQVGALSDTLNLGSPATQTVSLTGNGTGYPRIGLDKTSLSFGNVTQNTSAIQYVTITNTGTATLTVNYLYSNGTNPSNYAVAAGGTNPCTFTGSTITLPVGTGDSCTIQVTFTPTAVANYSAYLEGAPNTTASSSTLLALSQSKLIPFTGAGVSAPATAPAVSISPSSGYFFPATTVESGYQSGNGNPAVTLTNIGNAPLTFTGSTPFTIINAGTSSPISVYPNGSCTGTYVDFSTPLPAGDNCTITVQFWPQKAGVYAATLSVADNAADSPQTVAVTGIGKAGQLQFAPAQLNAFAGAIGNANACADTGNDSAASGAQLCTPSATAADLIGNIYIADPGKNVVRMVNSAGIIGNFAGGSLAEPCVATSSNIGDGCAAINATLNNPTAVAVDGFGNVYISDTGNARVRVVNAVTGIISTYAGNGSTGTFAEGTATSVPIVPNGIAFDQLGNLYIADSAQDIVIEVIGTNGNASVIAGIVGQPSHLKAPMGVAVDLNGDVYVADTGNNLVRELVNTGDGYTNTIVAGTGVAGNTGDNGPATSAEINANGVAVDAAGDLYISTGTSIRKVDLSGNITTIAGGGSGSVLPAQATSVGLTGIGLPGIDLAGDVLIPSGTGVAMAGPQGNLVFGSQAENTTSGAQIVTVTNTGNSSVNFYNPNNTGAVPGRPGRAAATAGAKSGAAVAEGTSSSGDVWTVTGDFAIASGGTCNLTTSGSIAAGASCTINVTFSPTQTGTRPGNITLYADGPNDIPAVINLSGTGTAPALITQTINFTQPTTPVTYSSGLTIPLVATGGASGNAVVFTIDMSSTGTGSITGSTLNVTVVGTFVIDANQAGNVTYSAAPQVQRSVVVTQAAQVINFTPPTTPVTYSSGLTIPLVATGGNSGNSVVFTIDASSTGTGSITGSTLNVTGVGTFVIDANQAGNTNYAAATQVQQSMVVNKAAQTITFNNPGAQTVGTPLALSATATSGLAVAFNSTTTEVCTVSGTQATFLTPGSCTIDANQSGNSTYAAAPMVPQSFTVNAAPVPSFTVTSPTAPQTVQPGSTATYTINVNPVNGSYTGAVTLSVVQSTLPTGATGSFSQNPVTPGSEGTSSTLTVQTAALTASNSGSSWPLAAPALALIGLFFVPGKRRRRWLMMGVLLLGSLGALTALSGCGGGFWLSGSTSTPYTITVNGANSGGVIVSTTTVQLTVQ